jgi:alkylation response protein AidB-like acyl-CoA dehydrogenase
MVYCLPDEQRQVQDIVRRVARERVAERAQEIDAKGEYPQNMFDLLRELGLFTLPFPVDYGGMNSVLAACLAIEELDRIYYNIAYLLLVQWGPFGAILAAGDDAQKQRYLPGLAAGELRGAISVTESQSGFDVAGIQTRAKRDGAGYRLIGSKIWCTNAGVADFVVVAAKTGEADASGSINLFIVAKDTPGFTVDRKEDKLGAGRVPSYALYFEDAYVPEESRLGVEGKGFKIVMETFNHSRRSSVPAASPWLRAPWIMRSPLSEIVVRSVSKLASSRACAG